MKNIPIPTQSEYMKKLIGQLEKIDKNMRWKAIIFLKDDNVKYKKIADEIELYGKEEKYGFKSVRKPNPVKELEPFEKELYDIAKNIEFRDDDFKHGKFQNELKKDLGEMRKLEKVIVPSSNFYTCDVPDYKNLRNENVQKEYRKSTSDAVNTVDKRSGEIAKGLKLDERMQKHSKKECFITLKDHKEDFIARPKCK